MEKERKLITVSFSPSEWEEYSELRNEILSDFVVLGKQIAQSQEIKMVLSLALTRLKATKKE